MNIIENSCGVFIAVVHLTDTVRSTMMYNNISGVMCSTLGSSGRSWDQAPVRAKPKTMKLVFDASLLSMQH
jgi:hypothetical protein